MHKYPLFILLFLTLALSSWDALRGGPAQLLANKIYDSFMRHQAAGRAFSKDIVFIDISQESLTQLEGDLGKWPWPRAVHSDLLQLIQAPGAKAVLFDILFNEKDVQNPESDRVFNKSLAGVTSYFPSLQLKQGLLQPTAIDPEHWRTGHINFDIDTDGIGRHYTFFPEASLPALVAHAAGVEKTVDLQSPVRLNFYNEETLTTFSCHELLHGPTNLESTGKYVIIGTTAPGLGDFVTSPQGTTFPGALVLATALQNLLDRSFITLLPAWQLFLLNLFYFGGLCLIFFTFGNRHSATVGAGWLLLSGFLVVVDWYLLKQHNVWLGANQIAWANLPAVMVLSLHVFLKEHQRRHHVEMTFSRFMDPKIVKKLLSQPDLALGKTAETKAITLLFSDIRGFTTLSEGKSPAELADLLNRYFTLQVQVIFKYGGTLDKFIGDAVMAFWGAPLDLEDPTDRALQAAREMIRNAESLGLKIGIGIHHGNAIVGLIGSPQRMEYTAIGDTVNLASRIEGLTKEIAPILISEEARLNIKHKEKFNTVPEGSFPVKGRQQPVTLLSVEGFHAD